MKNFFVLVVVSLFLISCTKNEVFVKSEKTPTQYNHVMALGNAEASFVHIATIESSLVDGHKLQATGMTQSNSHVFVVYNTQGEPVRGGLDIFDVATLGTPSLETSLVSAETEYAAVKYKDNHLYMVGQVKGQEKNHAVLTVVNVSDKKNPVVVSTLVFEDGRYATSLDIEGNKVYVSVPNVGLKIVDISVPSQSVLEKTEYLKSEESTVVVPFQSSTPSVPAGFTLSAAVSNEWSDTYNGRYGHKYQILFKHNFPNNVNGTPYYSGWELCFDSEFAIATEGVPWNVNIANLGGGKYKLTPKNQNSANLWSNTNADIGWNSVLSAPLNGRRIQNIKLTVQGQDCAAGEVLSTPKFDNTLFVKRYLGKSLVLGGKDATKLVFNSNSANSLLDVVGSQRSEAPSRFIIQGNSLMTNAGSTGLSIFGSIDTSPVVLSKQALGGTGNGLDLDSSSSLLYLAQGEEGLQVMDVASKSSPIHMGAFDYADDAGSANNVFLSSISGQMYVFVADGLGGVKIIKVQK